MDLWLKAGMLAGCGLCIIDADGGWGLQAVGCNLKKQKNQVRRCSELRLNLRGAADGEDGEDGGPGEQHRSPETT